MGDVPPPLGGCITSACPSTSQNARLFFFFLVQPKAGTPLLHLTRAPQWRFPAGGFPNPIPFLGPPPSPPSTHRDAMEVQPDPLWERRGIRGSSTRTQLSPIKPQLVPQPDCPIPEGQRCPQRPRPRGGTSRERRDADQEGGY